MRARKTAIAVPEVLLAQMDRAARERGESRNRYITRVLEVAVRTGRDAEITRKLDALSTNDGFRDAQEHSASELDEAGSDWTEERW